MPFRLRSYCNERQRSIKLCHRGPMECWSFGKEFSSGEQFVAYPKKQTATTVKMCRKNPFQPGVGSNPSLHHFKTLHHPVTLWDDRVIDL